jgi:hypothetical protein
MPRRLVLALLLITLVVVPGMGAAQEPGPEWLAFEPLDAGGVNVAVCGVDLYGFFWVVTSRATGTPPRVRAWVFCCTPEPILVYDWLPYDAGFGGGVSVSCSIVDGVAVSMTGAGFTGGPHARLYALYPPEEWLSSSRSR